MHMAWVYMTKYVDWTEKFFYHILVNEIRKYDISTPYTPTSPVGEKHNYGVVSDWSSDVCSSDLAKPFDIIFYLSFYI